MPLKPTMLEIGELARALAGHSESAPIHTVINAALNRHLPGSTFISVGQITRDPAHPHWVTQQGGLLSTCMTQAVRVYIDLEEGSYWSLVMQTGKEEYTILSGLMQGTRASRGRPGQQSVMRALREILRIKEERSI